jgi:hypothetical protein
VEVATGSRVKHRRTKKVRINPLDPFRLVISLPAVTPTSLYLYGKRSRKSRRSWRIELGAGSEAPRIQGSVQERRDMEAFRRILVE